LLGSPHRVLLHSARRETSENRHEVRLRPVTRIARRPRSRAPPLVRILASPRATRRRSPRTEIRTLADPRSPSSIDLSRTDPRALLLLALLATSGFVGVARAAAADDDFEPPAARAKPATDPAVAAKGTVATAKTDGNKRGAYEEVSFVLEHSLVVGPGDASAADFTPCGVFSARAHTAPDGVSVRLSHLRLTRDPIDENFAAAFDALVAADLVYRVRVHSNVLHPVDGEYTMAYLPARCLADAGLAETFALHTDERGGVIGVDYSTAGGDCVIDPEQSAGSPPKLAGAASRGSVAFRSTAQVRFYKLAPALDPDAPTDLRGHGGPATKQRQEEHRRRKESGEPREKGKKPVKEKTFWEKNWMYIVPISFLVSNALSAPPQKAKRG